MPDRQSDPARMTGRELEQWYRRSPKQIEDERRAAEARERAEFAESVQPGLGPKAEQPYSELAGIAEVFDGLRHGAKLPVPLPGLVALPGIGPSLLTTVVVQHMPKIPRPSTVETFIPIVGPGWEMAADLQDGNYAGAAFNGGMAALDALPAGTLIKGVRAANKGVKVFQTGSVSANASTKSIRRKGMATAQDDIHHSIPLNAQSRTAQDWRNHYALLKVLRRDLHRRLTGSWEGRPRFDPVRRVWHGTTDWMKTVPAGVAGYAGDAWENVSRPFGPHQEE